MQQISKVTMSQSFTTSLIVVCLIFSAIAFAPSMNLFRTKGSNDPLFIFTLLLLEVTSTYSKRSSSMFFCSILKTFFNVFRAICELHNVLKGPSQTMVHSKLCHPIVLLDNNCVAIFVLF